VTTKLNLAQLSDVRTVDPQTLNLVGESHQTVINVFAAAAETLELDDPWALMTKAGLSLEELVADRAALYAGPEIGDLPNLDLRERQALTGALAVERCGLSGDYLRNQPALVDGPLEPAPDDQIAETVVGPAWTDQVVAATWNRFGAIVERLAGALQIDPALAVAVLAVESGGRAFSAAGRMIIRFENHILWNLWGDENAERFNAHFRFSPDVPWQGSSHEWRTGAEAEWQPVHTDQQSEWNALNAARFFGNEQAAKQSISMGAPQIMGFNHAVIGYPGVDEMFDAFSNSAALQVVGFFDFIRSNGALLEALQQERLVDFAAGYNGSGQAEFYAGLIAGARAVFHRLMAPAPAGAGQPAASGVTPPPAMPFVSSEPPFSEPPIPVQPLPDAAPEATVAEPTAAEPTVAEPPIVEPVVAGAPPTVPPSGLPLPRPDQRLRELDPQLYEYWRDHMRDGFEQNSEMFDRVLDGFMTPYYTTLWMYRVLFIVGIAAFVAAVVLSVWQGEPLYALVFGGLSVGAFVSYFFNRPLQSLEENLQLITWLGVIYNSYWTRLAYMQDMDTVQQELRSATDETALHGKRPTLRE
jgi:hypothetical protein